MRALPSACAAGSWSLKAHARWRLSCLRRAFNASARWRADPSKKRGCAFQNANALAQGVLCGAVKHLPVLIASPSMVAETGFTPPFLASAPAISFNAFPIDFPVLELIAKTRQTARTAVSPSPSVCKPLFAKTSRSGLPLERAATARQAASAMTGLMSHSGRGCGFCFESEAALGKAALRRRKEKASAGGCNASNHAILRTESSVRARYARTAAPQEIEALRRAAGGCSLVNRGG